MLSVITKAFGLSTAPEHHPLMPRQINLSGNIVHFAMPENFSRDMPAGDMIESVNLSDESIYQDYQKFTLIRRWWDFKDTGFFGKEYGTLMMSLYIKQASENVTADTLKPLDFIDIIIDDIESNKPENPDPLFVYSDYFPAYSENWHSNQRWLKYIQGHANQPEMSILYAIPVTSKHYLVAEFISAANQDINIRGFIDTFTESFIEKIMHTFQIDYQSTNPVKNAVLKSDGPSLQQLIDDKLKQLEQLEHKN